MFESLQDAGRSAIKPADELHSADFLVVSPRRFRSLNCVADQLVVSRGVIVDQFGEWSAALMNQETSPSETTSGKSSIETRQSESRATGKKLLVRLVVLIGAGILLVIIGLPTIIAMAGLHNSILGRAVEGRELSASADSAVLAWFAPVSLKSANVKRDDQSWAVSAETFSTDKTLVQYVLAPSEIGTVNLDRPTVVLRPIKRTASDGDEEDIKSRTVYPELRTIVRDGSVEVWGDELAEPVIAVDEISFTGRTEVTNKTTMLIVEPVKLFDRRELTPELCDQGLQLIAPLLSDAAAVTGRLTVELDDFQIPLGTVTSEERIEMTKVSGRMQLHQVETGLKNPLLAEIANVLVTVSGGRFASVRASEETAVNFQVENGRVYHEGLTLLIPDLASNLTIQTSGWVDLDENIDVSILVDVSGLGSSKIEVLSSLLQSPLEIRMTGTLRHPRISLPSGQNMLDQLAGQLDNLTGRSGFTAQGGKPNLPGAITDLVGGLVGDSAGKPDVQKATRGIFDLIGAIRDKSDNDAPSRPNSN